MVALVVVLIPIIPISEAYNVTEPYERGCTYTVIDWDLSESWSLSLGFYVQSEVTVRNTDETGGTFLVDHNLRNIDGPFGTETDTFYLGAGQSHTSTATFDTSMGQDTRESYSVDPPTITDERVVTKHRTVYKSIIEFVLYG